MDIQFTRDIPEPQTQISSSAPRRRWDRWLYIIILIIISGSFLKWLIYPYFFDLSDGVLLQHQCDINFAEDIRIQDYYVEEGQRVNIGDTLFAYESQNNTTTSFYRDSVTILLDQSKNQTSLIEINAQIEKRRLFILENKKRLNFWKKEKDRKQQLVYLNSITPNELANVDRSIDEVSSQISSLEIEYRVLLDQKKQLSDQMQEKRNLQQLDFMLQSGKSYFISPVEGRIDRLRRPLYEVTYKKDVITSIIRPKYFVRAYIDIDKFDDFKKGDYVSVILPYQYKPLRGVVSRIYMVSELKEPELLEETFKYKSGVVMDIVPVAKEEQKWAELEVSNIPVKIRKFKIRL